MLRSNEPEAAWAKAEVAWAQSRSGDIHSKAPVGGTAFEQGVTERAPGQAGRSQERRGTGCRPEGTGPCNGAWDEAPEETLAHDTHPCPPPQSRRGPAAPRAGPQGSEERGREHGPERPPAPGMSRKEEKPVSVRR